MTHETAGLSLTETRDALTRVQRALLAQEGTMDPAAFAVAFSATVQAENGIEIMEALTAIYKQLRKLAEGTDGHDST